MIFRTQVLRYLRIGDFLLERFSFGAQKDFASGFFLLLNNLSIYIYPVLSHYIISCRDLIFPLLKVYLRNSSVRVYKCFLAHDIIAKNAANCTVGTDFIAIIFHGWSARIKREWFRGMISPKKKEKKKKVQFGLPPRRLAASHKTRIATFVRGHVNRCPEN